MKKLLIGATLAASLAVPGLAADLPRAPAPAPVVATPIAYNWSGFYVGVHGGGIWGSTDWTVSNGAGAWANGDVGGSASDGWLLGVQVGFNIQSGQWVFGIEGQWSWANADGDLTCANGLARITCNAEFSRVATLAGRVGIAFDRSLLYAKFGGAWVDGDFTATIAGLGSISRGVSRSGWMLGAGWEYAFGNNWSGKIEYNFLDLSDASRTFNRGGNFATVTLDPEAHILKLGLNYRFGGKDPLVRF